MHAPGLSPCKKFMNCFSFSSCCTPFAAAGALAASPGAAAPAAGTTASPDAPASAAPPAVTGAVPAPASTAAAPATAACSNGNCCAAAAAAGVGEGTGETCPSAIEVAASAAVAAAAASCASGESGSKSFSVRPGESCSAGGSARAVDISDTLELGDMGSASMAIMNGLGCSGPRGLASMVNLLASAIFSTAGIIGMKNGSSSSSSMSSSGSSSLSSIFSWLACKRCRELSTRLSMAASASAPLDLAVAICCSSTSSSCFKSCSGSELPECTTCRTWRTTSSTRASITSTSSLLPMASPYSLRSCCTSCCCSVGRSILRAMSSVLRFPSSSFELRGSGTLPASMLARDCWTEVRQAFKASSLSTERRYPVMPDGGVHELQRA
mmetsp:Transcript_38183/g.85098  ORF Transcript_38183/g.85098 Transcript_38183/m.85098 type:complete len:382 (-) Transcript_38183:307-1452(-)